MSWKRLDNLAGAQHQRRGLSPTIEAGLLCRKAEALYPSLFEAVSYRASTLHVKVSPKNLMDFKLIEGELLLKLNATGGTVRRIRLTVNEE